RAGVPRSPSRSGSSPIQRNSVRTASSASSRVGLLNVPSWDVPKRGWPACLGGDGSLDRRGGGPQPRSGMLEQVMSVRRIIEAFEAWRQRGESLVLASVYDTLGSTYTKPGHRILIASNGDYRGLVSGGCLEGDLAERARAVIDSGMPRAVTYDLRDDADDVWGLGVGCNGLIR